MNLIIASQILASLMVLTAALFIASFTIKSIKLRKLYGREYVRIISSRNARKLYPLVPKQESYRYKSTKRFLTSIGWKISVEGIYLLKWGIFAAIFFMLITIQNTNSTIVLREIAQDINYNHNAIDALKAPTSENLMLEAQLYHLVDQKLTKGREIYNKQNRQMYIEYIEGLIAPVGTMPEENLRSTAQRLYYKVLQTREISFGAIPYIYIFLISALTYHLPDMLGQIKRKLIEDRKNWEILNCMIVFAIFGRMPPYSVMNILEHMIAATEVYKPLLEGLLEGLKKGGGQEEAFDTTLEEVDRDELYELIETMKLARKTGLVNSLDDLDETINNTIKWIEIENIARRRTKILYAMTAVAAVMALGCVYFAYGLTVISNPANMLYK